jgi:hypothetical protein
MYQHLCYTIGVYADTTGICDLTYYFTFYYFDSTEKLQQRFDSGTLVLNSPVV